MPWLLGGTERRVGGKVFKRGAGTRRGKGGEAGRVTRACGWQTRCKEKQERWSEEIRAVRSRETARPEGDHSSRACETGKKREAGSDIQTELACWRSERRRDTGKEGGGGRGSGRGRIWMCETNVDWSHRQLMVLEHRRRRGGIGELETRREQESSAEWSAVVPPDQTMMGLYYPALLPVSCLLKARCCL